MVEKELNLAEVPVRELTGNQLAEKLQVNPATVRLWRTEGLPHTQLSERRFRYDLQESIAWLSNRMQNKYGIGGESK